MVNFRFLVGYLVGICLGSIGVFIFSDFEYMGIPIVDIFTNLNINFINGLYEFFWLGFQFNIFNLFIPTQWNTINFIDIFYPSLMGWFSAGLISGTIVKGVKRSSLNSFLVLLTIILFWLVLALISGANLTFIFITNLYETAGGLISAILFAQLGGIIGGLLFGQYSD
ncbi:MAG: hypothetical protein ACTSRZ_01850 [Promethearchaeota archaeon]